MPRVTIWIRQEDWDKWQAIDDKPAWLHQMINSEKGVITVLDQKIKKAKEDMIKEYFEPTVEPLEEGA